MIMRVIVAGSRTIQNYNLVESTLLKFFKSKKLHHQDIEIISGTARGADQLGEQFATKKNCKLTKFPADWDKYGKSAGYRRNAEMAKYAKESNGVLFAFWDGQSKGTNHMINLARENGLEVHVIVTKYFTADDEEPNCGTCDFVTEGSMQFCNECAGSWCHYRRTLYTTEL